MKAQTGKSELISEVFQEHATANEELILQELYENQYALFKRLVRKLIQIH